MRNQGLSGRVSVSPELLVQRLPNGEAVFLHLGSEQYFGLDPVGARMWGLLEEGRTFEDVLESLLAEYDVDRDRLRGDLEELVRQLAACGFIEFDDHD